MAFVKPSIKKTAINLKELRVYLRSVKKFGKSTLFRDVILEEYGDAERGLLVGIGNEIGYRLLDELNTTHVMTWRDMEELKKWLISTKGQEHNIEIIAFDVIDELIPIAEKEVCRLSTVETGKPCKSINSAFGGYGKGQDKVKEIIKKYFFDLYMSGFGLFAISHTKTKNIVEKGMEDTEGYTILTSNLSNSYEGIFGDIFDCVLTGMIDREVINKKTQSTTRKLFLRGTHYVDAGCRFSMGSVPEYINFDNENNSKEFIRVIKEGMKASKRNSKSDAKEVTVKPNIEIPEQQMTGLTVDIEKSEQKITDSIKEVSEDLGQANKSQDDEIENTITIEEPQETNEELFAKIRPLFTQASREDKQKVKDIVTSNGYTKFEMTAPNKMFRDIFELLNK